MLITDGNELEKFGAKYRIWQGVPGIEVTVGGRIFSTFYSGNIREDIGNFTLLVYSDDGGVTFSSPIAVVYDKEGRCYDPVLWIDPHGKLWFTWAYASNVKESGVFGVVCDNPDAENLLFGNVFSIGKFVMMNKPTVLTSGESIFPIAVWGPDANACCLLPPRESDINAEETGAFAYKYECVDGEMRFVKLGGAVPAVGRSFDEHQILEMSDGTLSMFIRTVYGIGVSHSYDGGNTWSEVEDSGLGGPNSRFFIGRLKSGRVLLINHHNFTGRNNLTALLSEDDGKTWRYSLLLDGRNTVSYPDAKEADDGFIYVTYDRERGGFKKSFDEAMASAREVLFAKITEEDIIAGKLVSVGSKTKVVISKLGEYDGEDPYGK